jgi:hypothetical protein
MGFRKDAAENALIVVGILEIETLSLQSATRGLQNGNPEIRRPYAGRETLCGTVARVFPKCRPRLYGTLGAAAC